MEQINAQQNGDREAITSQDRQASPIIKDIETERSQHLAPPLTFAEAASHNAFYLLTELREHAIGTYGETTPEPHLAELALSAAVVASWSRWQPISMHRAFLAGATLTEVAAAAGTTEAEAYMRWEQWTDGQTQLLFDGLPGVDPNEIDAIRTRIGQSLAP
jgi:hypothetical protein